MARARWTWTWTWTWTRLALAGATGMLGCGDDIARQVPATEAGCPDRALVAALSDYVGAAFLGTIGPDADVRSSIEYGADPVLRTTAGQPYFLNRLDGVLFPLGTACGEPLAKLVVSPPGAGWNPQDVAQTADALWVPFYIRPTLRVLPTGAQDGDPGVVDLSLAAYDPDGNPNASSAVAVTVAGVPKVIVSLGMLDDTITPTSDSPIGPKAPGLLVRYDAATHAAEGTFTMAGWNPFGQTIVLPDLLLYAMTGHVDVIGETTGGIELYDPVANVSRLILTEADLGGSVSQLAVNGTCGAAIVFGPESPYNPTSLVTFSLPASASTLAEGGAVLARNVITTAGYDLQGLAWQGDTLYVGDRSKRSVGFAVHRLARSGACTLTAAGDVIVPQMPVAFLPTSQASR